eukprot:TRINITY_DN16109_c0_g1_i1.p1 TRINITY_DN16109_c0_g1~~TRINITY_DN16109_c0_g1_i1.p1  ORF type:complete len:302 (-),score=24.18 TRINITY_DN16109_c0_g1_i1:12-866(-)
MKSSRTSDGVSEDDRLLNKKTIALGLCFGVILVISYFSGLTSTLSFSGIKKQRLLLIELVQTYPILSPLCFVVSLIVIVACSIPGATIMTLTAGFLFDQPYSTLYSVFGASTGACIIFYISKMSIGEALRRRITNYKLGETLELGLKKHQFVYLMIIRIVPIFPFWFVNIAPTMFGVEFKNFALGTYIGILPGSWVCTQAGNGLAASLDSGADSDTLFSFFLNSMLMNPKMILPIITFFSWVVFLFALRFYLAQKDSLRKPPPLRNTLEKQHKSVTVRESVLYR